MTDFVVEFAGDGLAFLFLGVHELGREVAKLVFGLGGTGELANGAMFQGGDADGAADGDEDADDKSNGDDLVHFGAKGELAEIQLAILFAVGRGGEGVDFVSDGEDGLPAWALLFAEEERGALGAFGGCPMKDGADGFPITAKFRFQADEDSVIGGGAVGLQVGDLALDGVAIGKKLVFVAGVLHGGRIEKQFADEDAVQIDAAFEFLEAGVALPVGLLNNSDLVVLVLRFAERGNARQEEQAQQRAEADQEDGPSPFSHCVLYRISMGIRRAIPASVRIRQR